MRAALVTVRQHRFEVGSAIVAAIAASLYGLVIVIRMSALPPAQECLDAVLASPDGSGVSGDCLALAQNGAAILGETFLTSQGALAVSIMGILPFLVGLLGGVPIVARELETGTALTAWSLFGSRERWLLRQVLPIAIILGLGVSLAAMVADPVADAAVTWGRAEATLIGLHGPLVLLRAAAAFGLGLAVGAILGRTLPAFVVGAALCAALLIGSGLAREAWTVSLEAQVVAGHDPSTGEVDVDPRALTTGWGVLTPDGRLLSSAEARELASAAGVQPASEHDDQDTPALEWYLENGYSLVPVGVSDAIALGWTPYDALIFGAAGAIGLGVTVVFVSRRRPR